jgi:molybdopterin synthase catalytic subunit
MRRKGGGFHEFEIVLSCETHLASARAEHRYDEAVHPPDRGNEWLGLTEVELPIGQIHDWVTLPGCGAVVLFSGTVRDHAGDRTGVTELAYESYEEQAGPRLAAVAEEIRRRWPMAGRIVLLHRTGALRVTESSVVVAVSTPHRPEAFEAARFAIDAVKATVPIWKQEVWDGGSDWGTGATDVTDAADVSSAVSSGGAE